MGARTASQIAIDLRRRARTHPDIAPLLKEAADAMALAAAAESLADTVTALRGQQPEQSPEQAAATPYWVRET
ncbi:MAG TPA: hypothetical protein VGF56_05905 [Rhizomicrobium sp.]|jgi:hypothetical protein